MAGQVSPDLGKHVCLPSGTKYTYVFSPPRENKPYILFLHGFPSSSYDWRHQIHFFVNAGYGVIAPDLLGYGGTDKPSELEAYRLKTMSDDIAGILDHHKIPQVIAVGHDWGSVLNSRLASYHPERVLAYAFLAIGYSAPAGKFDVEVINNKTEELLGYPIYGYWHFFNAPDAAEIMVSNVRTSIAITYPADPQTIRYHLCPRGAVREFYEKQMTGPLPSWISKNEVIKHNRIFSAEKGGYRGGLNWYKAQMANINAADDEAIPPERIQIDQPTLLLASKNDYVGVPALQEEQMKPFVKHLEIESLDCGHWTQLEKANEVNEMLKSFFEKHT
ncbi:MAG: hypothetical protein Q9216_005886 [Gyalolechia sp. 2 TL-2023]